ncbi:alpha-glucosidase [Pseudoroseicyclus sp. H15]
MDPLPWWKTATGYQIYPRSFCDSDGDGIGDIPGIISKLDHLADLGIGFIWLSPVYASPMIDNGYDISDYRDIAPAFGTLDDMDRLIAEAKARGIEIVMDLVVNHCSSEHPWFKAALASPEAPEHDYFVWREPRGETSAPPDDMLSNFGGPAWTYVPSLGKYYLHQFASAQPDLNWENPALRAEIYAMMNWWFDRGIGGFRMDVIDLIGKDVDAGIMAEGPNLHAYLQEMHRETLAGRDVVTVGESWSVTPQTGILYCGEDRGELSMVFQFEHVKAGWHETFGKWKPLPFDLPTFKKAFFDWQIALADDGWNSLFLTNHDLPRQVSKYGDDGEFRVRSAKLLATVLHFMKGTPFVYQGEEIGMTNSRFERLEQFRDVELFGHHEAVMAQGHSLEEFISGANANGRDNARTPMQWSAGENAGFTSGTPWIEVNPNHTEINVEADRSDPDGLIAFYRHLVHLRKTLPILTRGDFRPFSVEDEAIFAYGRAFDGQRLSVVANVSSEPVSYDIPEGLACRGTCLVHNVEPRDELAGRIELAPWEAVAILSE